MNKERKTKKGVGDVISVTSEKRKDRGFTLAKGEEREPTRTKGGGVVKKSIPTELM